MLSEDEVRAFIDAGHETRSVERKGAGSRDDRELLVNVARAAMALSNQRGGGYVFIGVADGDRTGDSSGLAPDELASWLDFDTVSAQINRYADPPVQITVAERHLPNGRPIVVVEVSEFDEIPTICGRDYAPRLLRGAIYTRSMAKVESSAAITQNELREVLALATEKAVDRFLRTASGAGAALSSGPSDADRFKQQSDEWAIAANPVLNVPHLRF